MSHFYICSIQYKSCSLRPAARVPTRLRILTCANAVARVVESLIHSNVYSFPTFQMLQMFQMFQTHMFECVIGVEQTQRTPSNSLMAEQGGAWTL